MADVYAPLLDVLERTGFWPVVLHVSGPLLAWLEEHDPAYLDRLGAHARAGRVELLASGFDEPILAMLDRADRAHQLRTMRETLQRRFGVEADFAWLTERVWEPDLAADLAAAGIRGVLVDDRHFLVSGFEPVQLHRPWRTAHDGRTLTLFPMHETLRYLIPFREPAETVEWLRALHWQGHRLAVLADDGEKFGGWPGTKRWVYEEGWLERFITAMQAAIADGVVRLTTLREAHEALLPSGPAYLPSASYREMEGWALPTRAAARLQSLEHDLGDRARGADAALLRGAHWKQFLAKYPEANRMHQHMLRISRLCRDLLDPAAARAAIGRAQCNDAYWHGVFGGLYLPFLRSAVWRNLIAAEAELRAGDRFHVEATDVDLDGREELLVTSGVLTAACAPSRGGALETFLHFGHGRNHADVLMRRREIYHGTDLTDGTAEIIDHTGSAALPSGSALPFDHEPRALFVERIVPELVDLPTWMSGEYPMLATWAHAECHAMWRVRVDEAALAFAAERPHLEKLLRFRTDGTILAEFAWRGEAYPEDCVFTTELSSAGRLEIEAEGAEIWRYPIETLAKSERGYDRTRQGEAIVVRVPVHRSALTLVVRPQG